LPAVAVVEVIVSAPPLMFKLRFPESAVCGMDALSVTSTVKLAAPAAVGVPEIAPAVLNDNPAGNAPDLTLQL
jgi:hypothetical protein